MSLYIDADLIVDETSVAEAILAGLADRLNAALDLDPAVDGWVPEEGQPETHFGESFGIVLATAAALTQDTERNDFSAFGSLILRIDREAAQAAVGYTTWSFASAAPTGAPYLIPDGSECVLDAPDGTPVAYATVGDVFADGSDATDVQVVAVEPGVIANGLIGQARDWEPLPFVIGVEMTTAPDGGQDEQTFEDYLDDIVRRARRMKVVPVVTDDYADQALDNPSVARAVAVRLLNAEVYPTTPATLGHITVFTVDANGQPSSSGVKADVFDAMAGADRPLAVTVHMGDPTYNDLTIAISIRLDVDADSPTTVAAVQAALSDVYNPARFGLDDTAPGRWRAPLHTSDRTITNYDVADLANAVPGVAAVTAVTVNGSNSVDLNGWAPLPLLTAPPAVTVVT